MCQITPYLSFVVDEEAVAVALEDISEIALKAGESFTWEVIAELGWHNISWAPGQPLDLSALSDLQLVALGASLVAAKGGGWKMAHVAPAATPSVGSEADPGVASQLPTHTPTEPLHIEIPAPPEFPPLPV